MFGLGSLPRLDPFNGREPERASTARNVRVLPQLEKGCSMKAFVETYTLLNNRYITARASGGGSLSAFAPRSTAAAAADVEQRNGRRRGNEVIGMLPFPIVVHVCSFINFHPVARFAVEHSYYCPMFGGIGETGEDRPTLLLVEEGVFDVSRIVSFNLRLAITTATSGEHVVIPGSTMFLNPDMTIGCAWSVDARIKKLTKMMVESPERDTSALAHVKAELKRIETLRAAGGPLANDSGEGVVLFDLELRRFKGRVGSGGVFSGVRTSLE